MTPAIRSGASQLDDDTRLSSGVLNYGCFLGRDKPNLELGSDSSFIILRQFNSHSLIQKSHKTWIIPPLPRKKYHTMVILGGKSPGNTTEILRKYDGNMTGNMTDKQQLIDARIVGISILKRF